MVYSTRKENKLDRSRSNKYPRPVDQYSRSIDESEKQSIKYHRKLKKYTNNTN